jgi:hypothetical protein
MDVIREAMGDLHLSEEPITDFYRMGKILGSGKYGVVRKGTSIKNESFNVAIKVIDM